MRNLALLLLLTTAIASAQYNFTSVNVLGNDKSAQIEIERNEIGYYYKAYLENNFKEDYRNFGVGFGYSTYINKWQTSLFYAGGKLGLINRLGNHPTVGVDTGVDFKIANGLLLGARYTLDWREDLKFYGVNYEPSLKGGIFFKISLVVK